MKTDLLENKVKIPDFKPIARSLADNHYCRPEKYCGHIEDIEAELEMAYRQGFKAGVKGHSFLKKKVK